MASSSEPAYQISGGRQLQGSIEVSGAKNAAMPCLAAALLAEGPCRIERAPDIADVRGFCDILTSLGVTVSHDRAAGAVELGVDSVDALADCPPDQLVAEQRASFLVMGALLARRGHASCGTPGGDVIGARPLDVHLAGFRALGAEVEVVGGRTTARAPRGLRGATLFLDYPSVLGTENLLLAAVLAEGRTQIVNAAMEPEVVCLAEMLQAMGARISGAGTHTIQVDGVEALHGVSQRLIPDRIEAGTLAMAAAISGGTVTLTDVRAEQMTSTCAKLTAAGVRLEHTDSTLTASGAAPLCATDVQAMPYPGFPTDLQAPITALLTQATGTSFIHERVFEDRMQHVGELRKLGANVVSAGATPVVHGPSALVGARVRGSDIRATAALVVAALAAEGQSVVSGVEHLDRGYEGLARKLALLGADIRRAA